MGAKSAHLGGIGERYFSEVFSEWLTGSKEELVIWRQSGSGSIATKRMKKGLSGKNVDGDFRALDLNYKPFLDRFYLDAKNYPANNFKDFNPVFINPNNQASNKILKQWLKTADDARKVGKIPLMPVKLRIKGGGFIPDLIFMPLELNVECNNIITCNTSYFKFKYMLLEEFFKLNNWKKLVFI